MSVRECNRKIAIYFSQGHLDAVAECLSNCSNTSLMPIYSPAELESLTKGKSERLLVLSYWNSNALKKIFTKYQRVICHIIVLRLVGGGAFLYNLNACKSDDMKLGKSLFGNGLDAIYVGYRKS